jgi:uncharacterized protein DUF1592/uncharacterized protein DUF1588/uncharacterized protein DUF1595/uncharacterized protein DUF1585/uncharacterized protein DUF1587
MRSIVHRPDCRKVIEMRVLPAAVLLMTALTACSGDPSGPGTGSDVGGSGSNSTGGGSSGGGGSMTPVVGSDGRYVCDGTTHGATAELRRISLSEYNNVITDVMTLTPGKSFPDGYGKSATGFTTEPALNVVGEQTVEKILNAAEEVALTLPASVSKILPCAKTGGEACAKTYLTTVGRRLFRRALTQEEQDGLLKVFRTELDDDAPFADALSVMTAQMLQMPAFLYLVEAPSDAGKDRARTGLELASRLSFHLWNSAPDDALLDAAEGGKLKTKADILEQANRLFADARSDRGLVRFFREWSGTDVLRLTSKDTTEFDYLNQAFATSVNDSFNKFVVNEVRAGNSLYDLLRSNSVYVDAKLAPFFGQPAVKDWTQVSLDATHYSGIMTQPGMLAALSHSTDPSYVFRGRFIRKRLLCQPIGSPPANAMAEFASIMLPEDPTAKDVASAVEAKPACGACHNLLDPGGLALEHFDAMGKYREKYESGKAIDTNGSLTGITDQPIAFTGPVDMMEALAQLPQTQKCFATQVFRYSSSRLEGDADVCAVQQIQDAMVAVQNKLDQAFLASTQTDAFMYRRGE